MGKRRRLSVRKIREMQRLKESKLSNRQIARAVNVSRPMVAEYLSGIRESGLRYKDIEEMKDDELMEIFRKRGEDKTERYRILSEKFEYYTKELKKPGVTLELLWKEYREEEPGGYSYGQFCYHYQVWREMSPLTMHIEHKAGDKMFVDYTGKKFKIYNRINEEEEVETFVSVLCASQLTYVEATESQKKEDWIKANRNALEYYGGTPNVIVPDCLKSGVTDGNKYEPDINPEYADFARHYNTVILPARPKAPKDKSLAENAVKLCYTRILAPLRDRKFYSIKELNEAIRERLEIHNNMNFQRMKISRRQLFEEIEKKELKPLPAERYELRGILNLKVPANYHIEVREDRHYYSVPWQYRSKRVTVIYTAETVEIYHNNIRIAMHKRDRRINGYTTVKEHMAPEHQFYADWSPENMIERGARYGKEVKKMVEKVLKEKEHPEQAYKICMGIFNLTKYYGQERVNRACGRALQFNYYSYKAVKNILDKGLDRMEETSVMSVELPAHENVRGGQYFN